MLWCGNRLFLVAITLINRLRIVLLCFEVPIIAMLHFLAVLLILAVLLVLQQKAMAQSVLFFGRETMERVKEGIVILHDDLIDDGILNLGGHLATLEDQEDEGFEEVLLLPEVLSVFCLGDFERIHGDGMLLGIGDIGTTEVAADSLVTVSGINHHHVRILLQQLAHHAIHVEALAAATGTNTEEISIVGVFVRTFLAGNVYCHG